MLRTLLIPLAVASAVSSFPLAAQRLSLGGPGAGPEPPGAVEEVRTVAEGFYDAVMRRDGAAVVKHLAEDVSAILPEGTYAGRQSVASHWLPLASEYAANGGMTRNGLALDGEVVRETGTYARLVESGICEWEFPEPKTERQARERLFCRPGERTPARFLERGRYAVTWKRSADGAWKVGHIELTGPLP